MWSLRLRSSALWCARLSACNEKSHTGLQPGSTAAWVRGQRASNHLWSTHTGRSAAKCHFNNTHLHPSEDLNAFSMHRMLWCSSSRLLQRRHVSVYGMGFFFCFFFKETSCSHRPAGFLQSGHNVRLHKLLQLKVASIGPEVVKHACSVAAFRYGAMSRPSGSLRTD